MTNLQAQLTGMKPFYQQWRCSLKAAILVVIVAMISCKPKPFIDLWLTPDQQGQILFKLEKFNLAANAFDDSRWQAFSLYSAKKYEQSAMLYAQHNDNATDKFYQANAFTHAGRYASAMSIYNQLLADDPKHQGAAHNKKLVEAILEYLKKLQESKEQKEGDERREVVEEAESGEGNSNKKPKNQQKPQEQLSAEQLLQDPELNKLWLRQVQKNPGQFLEKKFEMQLELRTSTGDSKTGNSNAN